MTLFPNVALKGGSREDKSYVFVAIFILIVLILTVIFLNSWYNPATISYSILNTYDWSEDISERDSNSQILNNWCSFTYKNNDEKTYEITRLAADELDCYAIANHTYKKPPKKKDPKTKETLVDKNGNPIRHKPNKKKKWID